MLPSGIFRQPVQEYVVSKDVGLQLDEPVVRSSLRKRPPTHEGCDPLSHIHDGGHAAALSDKGHRTIVLSIYCPNEGDPPQESSYHIWSDLRLAPFDLEEILIGKGFGVGWELLEVAVVFQVLNCEGQPHGVARKLLTELPSGISLRLI
jgi:hypothetical protein